MSLIGQASNSINYSLYKATYNPEAEAHAQSQAEVDQKAKEDTLAKEAAAEKAKQDAVDKAAADKAAQAEADRENFSGSRLAKKIFKIVGYIVLFFVLFVLAILGASFATNLNLHRELPYRILYALYGFGFFWLVVPYVAGYRWGYMGISPRFYGVIPLVPYRFEHPAADFLFGWMSYRPDDRIRLLEEWNQQSAGKMFASV